MTENKDKHWTDDWSLPQWQRLHQRLRLVATAVRDGAHRSRALRSNREFDQYRPYQQGDPLACLDWRLFARSRELFVRQTPQGGTTKLSIQIDLSTSMQEPSQIRPDWRKVDFAEMLLHCLMQLFCRLQDQWELRLYADDHLQAFLPVSGGHQHFEACRRAFQRIRDQPAEVSPGLTLPKSSRVGASLLISDGLFSEPGDILKCLPNACGINACRTRQVLILETDAERQGCFTGNYYHDRQQRKSVGHSFDRSRYLARRSEYFNNLQSVLSQQEIDCEVASIDANPMRCLERLIDTLSRGQAL